MFGFRLPQLIRTPRPRRQLAPAKPAAMIEKVEPRLMLDGNITATLNANGHLKLIGDEQANDLIVTIAADGSVSFSSNSTTVNDQTAEDVTLTGTVQSIASAMRGGGDSVIIQGASGAVPIISGGLSIRLGDGGDSFTLRGVRFNGRVYAAGEGDNDVLTVEANEVDGELIVAGNRNDDRIAVRDIVGGNDVLIRGGGEIDDLTIGDNVMAGDGRSLSTDMATRNESDVELVYPEQPADPDAETATEAQERNAAETEVANKFAQNPHQQENETTYNRWLAILFSLDPQSISFTPAVDFPTDFPDFDADEFQTTASGLMYRIIDAGTGATPIESDSVSVNYQGVLPSDGSQFDSSYDRGTSSSFSLQGVIDGWTEGLQLVGEGGMIQLLIPSYLAYGGSARSGIPADSALFFNIELLEIAT